ncbi:unnamed protein product [Parajaminaea phylloscopi]
MPAPLDKSDPYVARVYRYGPYGYLPHLAPPLIFTIAYALLFLAHTARVVRSRRHRWMIVVAIGCAFECAGNALRILGHYDPQPEQYGPYIAMQVLVVGSPVFFAAAHFTIVGKTLELFGRPTSPVPPKLVVPLFVVLDVASLAIQGVGSSKAAIYEIDGQDPQSGADIIIGGLGAQLLGYVGCNILAGILAWRVWLRQGGAAQPAFARDRRLRVGLLVALASNLLVVLRSAFRVGEMSRGWIGPVTTTEWYYYVFDAVPVTVAVVLLVVWHPADYLFKREREGDDADADADLPAPARQDSSASSVTVAAGAADEKEAQNKSVA